MANLTAQSSLILKDVSIALGDRKLLEINAEIKAGEVLTIMGPSGSGKSTLLAWIGGFLSAAFTAKGSALLGDEDLQSLMPQERRIGFLFQDPLLFPHMTVLENLVFALPPDIKGKTNRMQKACMALEDIGLENLENRDPETLSGGQKARVALARVLLSSPRILLLDEPFSKLDANRRDQMRRLVFERARTLPVLLVTHDEADAIAAGGPIIRIQE